MKKLLTLIFILAITTSLSAAEYKDSKFNPSMRSFICGSEFSPIGSKEEFDYFWYSTSFAPVTRINPYLSYINSFGMGLLGSREASAPQIEYRLLGRLNYGGFYIQAGGGLSHAFNPGDLPHLADSPLYGIISAELGYEFNETISISYVYEHLSSPFHADCGWNVGGVSFTVKF